MTTHALGTVCAPFAVVVMLGMTSTLASAQQADAVFTVQGTLGTEVGRGGHAESFAVGLGANQHATLLVGIERMHFPRSARTSGGILTFGCVHLRIESRTLGRAVPYATIGIEEGVWKSLGSKSRFSPPSSDRAGLVTVGGGLTGNLRAHLSIFVDVRVALGVESDVIFMLVPVRAGLSWRF